MKRWMFSILVVAPMALACGGPAGPGLSPENAAVAGGALAASAQGAVSFSAFDPGAQGSSDEISNGARAPRASSQFADLVGIDPLASTGGGGCSTESGDPSDPDMDGIPVDRTVTFDCMNPVGNTTFTFTGSQYLRDTQPQVNSALNFSAGQDAITLGASWPQGSAAISETWNVTGSAAGLDLGLETTASISGTETHNLEGGGTETNDFSVNHSLDATLVLLVGDATIDGDWSVTANGEVLAAASVDSDPTVHVDIACPTYVDSGAIEAIVPDGEGGNDEIRVVWSACGQYQTFLNGDPVGHQGPVAGGGDA